MHLTAVISNWKEFQRGTGSVAEGELFEKFQKSTSHFFMDLGKKVRLSRFI